jgi:hypothetical protein
LILTSVSSLIQNIFQERRREKKREVEDAGGIVSKEKGIPWFKT